MTDFTDFDQYLHTQDRAELTHKSYLSDLRFFARWFEQTNGEAFSPQNITPSDIRTYREYLQTVRRLKASTINRRLSAISTYLDWAVQTGQIEHNPAKGIKLLPQEPPRPRWLDKKEQYALQRAIERDLQLAKLRYPKRWLTRRRDATLVILLLNTGLRISEVLALRLGDVEISERKGQVTVRYGKGRKQRSVPLNKQARQALQRWLEVRPEVPGNDYLFLPLEGDYPDGLHVRSAHRAIRRYGEDAGIMGLGPHMLRHTFAKNLVDAGVSLEKVAALLGHSSLNTTRIYITPGQKDLERAVERLA
jgi:integrase/recombinase XerC